MGNRNYYSQLPSETATEKTNLKLNSETNDVVAAVPECPPSRRRTAALSGRMQPSLTDSPQKEHQSEHESQDSQVSSSRLPNAK